MTRKDSSIFLVLKSCNQLDSTRSARSNINGSDRRVNEHICKIYVPRQNRGVKITNNKNRP